MKMRGKFWGSAALWLAWEIAGRAQPVTVVDLQPFRQAASVSIRRDGGWGAATLTNLNPAINAWYLLEVRWNGAGQEAYHLENPNPGGRTLMVDAKYPQGIVVLEGNIRYPCDLFSGGPANALEQGRASARVFYPLCEGRVYLRNPVTGHRTALEAATEFLREHIWGGEKIVNLGHILLGDIHRETGKIEPAQGNPPIPGEQNAMPLAAATGAEAASELLEYSNMGIQLEGPPRTGLAPGAWYPASANPGVYAGLLRPDLIDPAIFTTFKGNVNNLDGAENSALCYLAAFDLDRFQLGYALGTEHPGVGWSERVLPQMRDSRLPGPDGIGSISPLIATGLVSPQDAAKTVATFTGGFKRMHGAFKYGDLALRNHGSHYGFIENGVVLSKLQPGLATVFVLADGSFGMKTWTEADGRLLPQIRDARQNGVPIIEFDAGSQSGAPGPLVNRWGPGNWSGSEDMKLRTMRSGLALQRNGRKLFLIYAVFSDATPSAMARVFQAYHCDYAMLLDMNALEHTYLAVYRRAGPQLFVDHLIQGMNTLEKSTGGEIVPRFLGYADNRDFFFVLRR